MTASDYATALFKWRGTYGLIILAIATLLSIVPANAEIVGKPRVIDGDTIEIAGQRIRLHGIDAPESGQSCEAGGKAWQCGQEAGFALTALIGGKVVSCTERDRDRYGRTIAVCTVGETDINGAMVAQGWALAYRRYSGDYADAERAAKAAGAGMWRGAFIPPWDWRRGSRLAAEAANDNRECQIKGNVSKSGRIYHVPGGYFYERTKINEAAGERWFCSEVDAVAAGWRRSKR